MHRRGGPVLRHHRRRITSRVGTNAAGASRGQPHRQVRQLGGTFRRGHHADGEDDRLCEGQRGWDSAFDTISGAFKKLKTYIDKEGLKTDGPPMTIFTQTDDTGFQFQAAVPIADRAEKPAARRYCQARQIASRQSAQIRSPRFL